MIEMKIEQMAQIMQGSAHGQAEITTKTIFQFDSRQINSGDIFLALKGEKADGHDFVSDACARGASLSIVNRGTDSPERIAARLDLARSEMAAAKEFEHILVNHRVEDVLEALLSLATS